MAKWWRGDRGLSVTAGGAAVSLILDALNRSRQDARQMPEQAPGLDSPHFREPPAEAGIRWLVLLAVGLCIALGVIAWLVLDRPTAGPLPERALPGASQPTAADVGVAPAPAQGRPAEEVAQGRIPIPEPAPAMPPPSAEPVPVTEVPVAAAAAVPEPTAAVAAGDATPLGAPAEPAAPAATVEDDEVASLYRQQVPTASATREPERAAQPAATPAPRREERPIDIEAMVTRAQTEMANRGLPDNPVPLLASLSQQFKDSVPSLMYLRHDYSGLPGKSTVVINGKTVAAGGTVSGGIKVEEILPDSVILSYQGTRFRLRALNSWVNL